MRTVRCYWPLPSVLTLPWEDLLLRLSRLVVSLLFSADLMVSLLFLTELMVSLLSSTDLTVSLLSLTRLLWWLLFCQRSLFWVRPGREHPYCRGRVDPTYPWPCRAGLRVLRSPSKVTPAFRVSEEKVDTYLLRFIPDNQLRRPLPWYAFKVITYDCKESFYVIIVSSIVIGFAPTHTGGTSDKKK